MGDLIELLERIFQGPLPAYLLWTILIVFLFVVLLRSIPFFHKEILPIFYSAEKARRRNRRQRFAEHIEHELRRLNSMEEWSDYRFTELEAEVEAEGRRRSRLLPFLVRRDPLRREPSLTRALANSTERLILLEGAPGSGKSVALRHVALQMAKHAMRSRSISTVIPIHVNLKLLKRRPSLDGEEGIDAELIRRFVLQSINRANDRDVASFLDDEFQVGLNDGLWLFLFDSFDEIPEILSSTEADSIIAAYAQAISDFLHGMNLCRGVVASREYRGPKYLTWSRFRIMPLSSEQQRQLIIRAGLSQDDETKAVGGLNAGSQSARHFIENPMFLSLLCEYVREHHTYPPHDSHVFGAYIENRFVRDQERVEQRFNLSLTDIHMGAESVAFCMLYDSTLGLSATRQQIAASLLNHELLTNIDINCVLDALHFIKLGKVERESPLQEVFTFSHRRLQEQLATTLLLREPDRVTPLELLTNGVWRESAVVILQLTESPDELRPIIDTGTALIARMILSPPFDVEIGEHKASDGTAEQVQLPQPFPWPPNLLHVLNLLQDGLHGRAQVVPELLRLLYTVVVNVVWNPRKWLLSDMQAALSVSSLVSQDFMGQLLLEGLTHPSSRLQGIAYEQATSLGSLRSGHIAAIRFWLVDMAKKGQIYRQETTIKAYLLRLNADSSHLLDIVRFLKAIPYISFSMCLALISLIWVRFIDEYSYLLLTTISSALLLPFLVKALIWTAIRTQLIIIAGVSALVTLGYLLTHLDPYSSDLAYGYLFLLGYTYAFEWQEFASAWFARSGKLVKPVSWPVAMLLPIVLVPLRLVRKGVSLSIGWFRARFKDIQQLRAERLLFPAFILFLIITAGLRTFSWLMISRRLPWWLEMGIVVIPFLWFMVISGSSLLKGIRSASQERRQFRAIQMRTSKIPPLEYLLVIRDNASFGSNFPLRYTRVIRERHLLETTGNALLLLDKLISQLQHDLLQESQGAILHSSIAKEPTAEDEFTQWYVSFLEHQKQRRTKSFLPPARAEYRYGIAILGWDMLDELNLLLVQLRDSQG